MIYDIRENQNMKHANILFMCLFQMYLFVGFLYLVLVGYFIYLIYRYFS